MSHYLKFRLDKLRRYLALIGAGLARERVDATDICLLEPAEPRYDAPPAEGPWRRTAIGEAWGGKQQWAYFRGTISVPPHWHGGAVELRLSQRANYLERPADDNFPAGPEGQVFVDALRVGAIDPQHTRIRFPFVPGRRYDLCAVFFAGRCACRHALEAFGISWLDAPTERLYRDLRIALDIVDVLDEASVAREKLIAGVDAVTHAIDVRYPGSESFYASVPAAQRVLDDALRALEAAGDLPHVVCIGNAHIDLGWLWPIRQTHHKCVRTFATQCRLLEAYGGWTYFQSSPQAYAWVERDAPELFEKIRHLVAAGRWEADGATWAECDTNLPNGESLVRQLLYGKRFLREKFGVESRVLWMPDCFGFSAALPQLLRLAGVEGFVTSKISWSQYNRFPFDTFRWRGLDGTEVVAHFISVPGLGWTPHPEVKTASYNAMMTVKEVKLTWQEYRQKHLRLDPLLAFGFGDGGGGPNEMMLETAAGLAAFPPIAGLPRVRFEKASALLHRIAARADELPVWEGELYLEYHRGTFTTQGWIKRANRKNEVRLHNLEWLGSLAAPWGHSLDKSRLDGLWQDMLLLQFHDILPGSSVGELYDEARALHARIAQEADRATHAAMDVLCRRINTSGMKRPVAVFNTLSWDRREPLMLPDGVWRDDLVVPAGGWAVMDAARPTREAPSELQVTADASVMSNPFWRLRLDEQGCITELYDKRNDRPVLPKGAVANEWQLFEDRPMSFDAWDIDLSYQQHRLPGPKCLSRRVVERGPVRAAVEIVWKLPKNALGLETTITQRLALYANHPRIDFETQVDWHEHDQLLKVAFPAAVRATEATYEVQFGHIRRPTHRNTSWDLARFEVCGHRFVDLSEHGYGVALLNDCKYGHDVYEGVVRLTCIKSPQAPDADADQGLHELTYALLPHAGSFQEAGVIRASAELNNPLLVRELQPSSGDLPAEYRFVRIDHPAVILDTLKPAEDGDGLIGRLYESHGSHARATLTFAQPVRSVEAVNLLEERLNEEVALQHSGNLVCLMLRPFQVVSLRLRM